MSADILARLDALAAECAAPAPAVEGLEVLHCIDVNATCDPAHQLWQQVGKEYWDDDDVVKFVRQSDAARLIAERDARIATLENLLKVEKRSFDLVDRQIQTVEQERDTLRARCESLSPFPTEALASLEQQNAELRARIAEIEKARTEPVSIGVFYFGGNMNGRLYSHCDTQEQADRYIADRHQSDDTNTFRSAPLYAAPPDAAAIIADLGQQLGVLKGDPRCDVSCMLSCSMEGKSVAQERDQLRDEVERLTAELADEIDESVRLKTEGLRAELAAANERIAALDSENTSALNRVGILAADKLALENEIRSFDNRERETQEQLDVYRAQNAEFETRIAALEQDAARYRLLESIAYEGVHQYSRKTLWCLRGLFSREGQSFTGAVDAARKEAQP